MVGRDAIVAAAMDSVHGGVGVVLRGGAGVGKSRLLVEIVDRLGREGIESTALHATAATASIPLGVFLSVLGPEESVAAAPVDQAPPPPVALLRLAGVIRSRLLQGSPAVVCVDDAHLLDPPSAGLLLELGRSGAILLLALRDGAPVADAVSALWHDGVATVVRVDSLDTGDTHALVAALLDGPVDRGLSRAIAVKSGGNPLFITEIVRSIVVSGVATVRGGVWTLVGQMPLLPHLTDYLAVRIDELDPEILEVVELLAVAGSLGLDDAIDLVGETALENAETAGLVTVRDDSARADVRGVVRLAHPLYVDAVLAELTALKRSRVCRRLSDALLARTRDRALTVDERVDLASWRLTDGTAVAADELVALAELVYTSDPALCNRFVAAALEARRGVFESLRLAMLLAHLHRRDDAERLLESLDEATIPPGARAIAVASRAYLLGIVGHRPGVALEIVDAALLEHGALPVLRATRTDALWQLGRFVESTAYGRPLFFDEGAPATERVMAGAVLSMMAISGARRDDYLEYRGVLERLLPLAVGMPEGHDTLQLQGVLAALNLDQDLERAERLAQAGYQSALERGNESARTEFTHLIAWMLVLRGDLPAALPLLTEVNAGSGMWARTTRPWTRSHYVRALVLDSRAGEARIALDEVLSQPHAPVHDVSLALASAGVLAAEGALDEAGRRCAAAASDAAALGQAERARAAWFGGLRYGDARSAHELHRELSAAGDKIEVAKRALARAWLDSDAPKAETAATTFARRGLLWYAIDAQAMAVAIRRASLETAALASARLAELRLLAHGLTSPTVRFLAPANPASELTPRELEIARLAAHGHPDRVIAERLLISVRTVNTHLGRVYEKLAISGRARLAAVLRENDSR